MIRVILIEDEQPAIDKLEQLLKRSGEEIEIVKVLTSVEESVNYLSSNKLPDLIFIDIQLSDGLSFEIFESVTIDTPVIFTTAYDSFAIKAFQVNSIDYLLKPIDGELLQRALQKFRHHHLNSSPIVIRETLSQFPVTYKSRFLVKLGVHYRSVPTSTIEAFYVNEKTTYLVTNQGKTFDIDHSLDQLEKMIDPELFFRVSRNFLVNISGIKEMLAYSGNRLKIKMEHDCYPELILVSRDRLNSFKLRMDR